MPPGHQDGSRPPTSTLLWNRDLSAGRGARALPWGAGWRTPAQIPNLSRNRCSHGRSGSLRTLTRRRASSVSVGPEPVQLFRESKCGFPRQEGDRTGCGDRHRGDLGSAAGSLWSSEGDRGRCHITRTLVRYAWSLWTCSVHVYHDSLGIHQGKLCQGGMLPSLTYPWP
ncbi:EEF1A lysine methyltransferase 3 isoform X5 [Macaca fascicularis]|uniref:EEF1A lysine methyltransferase 3 isoform X5 n=1 Tax=Macaca fascicularis TaxID=9541 RepID=UPI003D156CDD